MWGQKRRAAEPAKTEEQPQRRLKDALRKARIDSAERTGVVVELHDTDVARLELLSEALDPLFAEIPAEVDLFDRGISRGDTPRLWLDAVAHIGLGRDRRMYRFVQDTRFGRKVLAESTNIPEMTEAVTKYLAQRMIERERALVGNGTSFVGTSFVGTSLGGLSRHEAGLERLRQRNRAIRAFVFGLFVGVGALVLLALLTAPKS